jgi:hypothetical protein
VKKFCLATVAIGVVTAPVLVFAFAPAPDSGSRTVEHKTYNGYAESRDSGLKGDASFLALTSKAEFSRVFDPVLTPRGVPDPVGKSVFDERLFVAVIKRSDVLWDYKVEKVTAGGDTLTVSYRATPRGGAAASTAKGTGTARAATQKEAPSTTASTERAKARARASSATIDSSLILSVTRDRYLSVVFMENGKKAGTARVGN